MSQPPPTTEATQQTQQTHDEFMIACKADGTDEATCQARWDAAHQTNPEVSPQTPPPGDRAALYKENELLRARLELRERQLKQAIDIANRANELTKAKDSAQKTMLVTSIQMDSHFTKEELEQKNLTELQTIRLTLDKSMEKTFASVAADIASERDRRKPLLTAGAWDETKKQWVGGN